MTALQTYQRRVRFRRTVTALGVVTLLALYIVPPSLALLAVIVPVVMLTVGAMLLAYGLVTWCYRVEQRNRIDGVTYTKWGRW